MNDLVTGSAIVLAERLRRGEVSSVELLRSYLERIEVLNPRLNAVVTLDVENAQRRAEAADRALARGESWGPLHGLPMTVKDTLETAGVRTTAGAPELSDHVPGANAVAVQRLVDAGAIVFGKTNTPYMAGDWQTYNSVFGTTNNPWDQTRAPGGSSGGSATAVAAGLTAAELGSDIGGSIRIPANWCGVYGHKPTHGLVPTRGHIPGPPGTLSEPDLAVLGPLARSAADLDLLLGILAGPLPDRARAWRLQLPETRFAGLREYRVAAWLDDAAFPVDREVRDCLEATIEALRSEGVKVDDEMRPSFAMTDLVDTYRRLLFPILFAGLPVDLFEQLAAYAAGLEADAGDGMALAARFGTLRYRDWAQANEKRHHLRSAMAAFFERCDILLCPAAAVAAIPHDQSEPMFDRKIRVNGEERSYSDLFAWIALATTTWLPATVAPVGRTAAGLPVGIQIVAPYLEDRTAIAFAARLGEVIGAFEAPTV